MIDFDKKMLHVISNSHEELNSSVGWKKQHLLGQKSHYLIEFGKVPELKGLVSFSECWKEFRHSKKTYCNFHVEKKQMGSKKSFPRAIHTRLSRQHIHFLLGFSEHDLSVSSMRAWWLLYIINMPKFSKCLLFAYFSTFVT